jgi:hypothetical protein
LPEKQANRTASGALTIKSAGGLQKVFFPRIAGAEGFSTDIWHFERAEME